MWGKSGGKLLEPLRKKNHKPINFPHSMPQRRKRLKCFFSTWKNRYTYSFRCSALPVLKMYFLSEEIVTHIRFKIRVSEPQRRKQFMCLSALEKRKWLKCFSPLEKSLRICFSLTRPYFLKMYFLSEETVTHIRFKIRVSEPQRRKQLMCFSALEKREWFKCFSPLEKDVLPFRKNRYTYSFQDKFFQ